MPIDSLALRWLRNPWLDVPYLTTHERRAGKGLLVTFPGIAMAPTMPRSVPLSDLPLDDYDIVVVGQGGVGGPINRHDWRSMTIAMQIVERECALRGITSQDAVFFGSSYAGSSAIYAALRHGVPRVIVSSPAIHLGTLAAKFFNERQEGDTGLRTYLYESGRISEEAHLWDNLLVDAGREATVKTTIDILISRDDFLYDHALDYERAMADCANAVVRVTEQDYGPHVRAEEALYGHLRGLLA
ncbi:MAG: hypothetical protein JWO88_3588 [Frankiales bacterium]|nr:hypothetical protein [Frankiales bacterium]